MTNTDQTGQPEPPTGCTCGSFWTTTLMHKLECPLSGQQTEDSELRDAIYTLIIGPTSSLVPAGIDEDTWVMDMIMGNVRAWADRRADRHSQAVGVDGLRELDRELHQIIARHDGLHGITHNIMGGKMLSEEHCVNCKETAKSLMTVIQAKITEAYEKGKAE